MSDRTEAPTPRRLRKAREAGDSGASPAASQAVGFLVMVAVAPAAVGALVRQGAGDLRAAIAGAAGADAASFDPMAFARAALSVAVPAMLAAGVAGAAAQLAQTGGGIALARLAPRLDRLDPIAGLGRLFGGAPGARLFAVARALAGSAAVAWLAYGDLVARAVDVARVAGRAAWAGVVAADMAETLAWHAAAVGLVLGGLDALFARRSWLGRLRMTKDEVKREHREAEGDPLVRAARQRAYQEILAQAAIAAVRTASVVVTNPTHLACALRYDEADGDEAPVVVASGEGDLAARIARAAEEWGVPVVRDVPLAHALVELSVGDAIPEALYEAVAEILRALWQAP